MIEANPRASRTVPFVAKATGVPLVKVAARVMVGATLAELRAEGLLGRPVVGGHVAVKEAVLPFNRFPDADTVLGPEMRSTGEVMGIDLTFGLAFAKSQIAAGDRLPESGTVFLSLADRDKADRRGRGHGLPPSSASPSPPPSAPPRTCEERGVEVATVVAKLGEEGGGTTPSTSSQSGKVDLVVNTPGAAGPGPTATTSAGRGGAPTSRSSRPRRPASPPPGAWPTGPRHELRVRTLQEYHRGVQPRDQLSLGAGL